MKIIMQKGMTNFLIRVSLIKYKLTINITFAYNYPILRMIKSYLR